MTLGCVFGQFRPYVGGRFPIDDGPSRLGKSNLPKPGDGVAGESGRPVNFSVNFV